MSEEDRYVEIVSTQKIRDTESGIEYDGLIDDKLLKKLNETERFRKHNREERNKLIYENELLWDAVQGFLALEGLRSLGYL